MSMATKEIAAAQTRFSSRISEKNSPINGEISSSYDEDVSMKVYRTAAATSARFFGVDLSKV